MKKIGKNEFVFRSGHNKLIIMHINNGYAYESEVVFNARHGNIHADASYEAMKGEAIDQNDQIFEGLSASQILIKFVAAKDGSLTEWGEKRKIS